jgi:8-oxo-dGTP pyrophosphatase MutT (NUDIX family)
MTVLDPNYDPTTDGAVRKAGAAAVRPRDAATLIVVRRDGPEPRVLMGRRSRGHDFMPGKWVFPGGRVDPADARAPCATELEPAVLAKLALTVPARRPALARALALAAVRETFEEVGLLLARPGPTRPGAGPWRPFLAQGALPDLAALRFVARAITPPYRPKRFDARFFMADAEALVSLERAPDCGELDEIAWVDLPEALALDLPNITRFVLGDLVQRLNDPDRPIPSMRFERGARRLEHL